MLFLKSLAWAEPLLFYVPPVASEAMAYDPRLASGYFGSYEVVPTTVPGTGGTTNTLY